MPIPLPTLERIDRLTIATPCDMSWEEMAGDDRKRFCGECRKHVYDIASMTSDEVADLLGDGMNLPCVRLYRRQNGRVMTADCPVGVRERVWRNLRRRAAWMGSLFAMLFLPSCQLAFTQGQMDVSNVHLDQLPKNLKDADSKPTPTEEKK